MRHVDALLYQYSSDHQNSTNHWIHLVCVPAIVWSVTAMLWCIPVPSTLANPGLWSGLAMFAAFAYYWRLSKPLAIGLLQSIPAQARSAAASKGRVLTF